MKSKIILALLVASAKSYCAGGYQEQPLTEWQSAIHNDKKDTMTALWEKAERKVPTNQMLAAHAVYALAATRQHLLKLARDSQPPVDAQLANEQCDRFSVVREFSDWKEVATFLKPRAIVPHIEMNDLTACLELIEHGADPVLSVVTPTDGKVDLNVYEFLLVRGNHHMVPYITDLVKNKGGIVDHASVPYPVHCAVQGGPSTLEFVLKNNLFNACSKVNVRCPLSENRCPIHDVILTERNDGECVSISDKKRMIDLLAQYGANLDVVHGDEKETPSHMVAIEGIETLLACLEQLGANPKAQDSDGDTPRDILREKRVIDQLDMNKLLGMLRRSADLYLEYGPSECRQS